MPPYPKKKENSIDTRNFDKAGFLCALFNQAKPSRRRPAGTPMTYQEAQHIINSSARNKFALLHGRKILVDLDSDNFDAAAYDYHNGKGKAQEAVYRMKRFEAM